MDAAEFESVLIAAQGGSEWAWSRLYHWLAPDLRAYAKARGADSPDDALGEIFLQLARRVPSFSGSATQFRSWAFMIAHNRVIDQYRKRVSNRSMTIDPTELTLARGIEDVEAEALAAMTEEELRGFLANHLSEDQQAVVLLRIFGGLDQREIAEILGKSVGSVKVSQHRAFKKLRKVALANGVTR